MSSLACIFTAGVLFTTHNTAMPPDRSKMPGPQLPSFIVAIALLNLVYDNRLISQVLGESPVVYHRLFELAMALIVLEVGIHVIWMPIERFIHFLTKIFLLGTGLVSEEYFWRSASFCVGCVTVPLSVLILVCVGCATDHFNLLHNRGTRVETKVGLNVDAALRYLRRNQRATGMPLPEYAERLQRYKDAATRRRRGLDFQTHFQYDSD